MAKKKQQEIEFNDEYFLNLTMKYDERNDDIYPKWAMWCANSEDKYYIDGKDGYFYTHIRTPEEIAKERKRREIQELIITKDMIEGEDDLKQQYEDYLRDIMFNEEQLLEITPLPYEEWKNQSKESAE